MSWSQKQPLNWILDIETHNGERGVGGFKISNDDVILGLRIFS